MIIYIVIQKDKVYEEEEFREVRDILPGYYLTEEGAAACIAEKYAQYRAHQIERMRTQVAYWLHLLDSTEDFDTHRRRINERRYDDARKALYDAETIGTDAQHYPYFKRYEVLAMEPAG